MSLSNSNGGQASNLYILKPVSKNKEGENVRPYFEVSKSEAGKWVVTEDQGINNVTGTLFKIEAVEEEYKGDKYYRVRVYLKDGDESYLLPCRMNIASRSMFNSLFNLTSFEGVSIRYYQTKSGYDAFFVSQNGEKVSWKYESQDMPSPEEIPFKGKIIRDFTALDKFFVDNIELLNQKLQSPSKAESNISNSNDDNGDSESKPVASKTSKSSAKKQKDAETEEDNDDIPF